MSATVIRMEPSCYASPRLSWRGFGGIAALHVATLVALMQLDPAILPAPIPVLSISLLPAAPLPSAPPAPAPPPALRPNSAPPSPPVSVIPVAPVVDAPAPLPVAPPSVAAQVSVAAPAPPAPTAPAPAMPMPPRFDAAYLDNPAPAYPVLSRRLGEEGRVVLRVRVAPNGLPTDVALAMTSGSARLDQAAADTVRHWRFVPARQGTEVVAASVLVPIVFSLKD